ncbi:MAG: NADPH:quinone reductase-like Zn-dependent oxidoreductase [Porticoccaceae bacterium]|jgi:NADPH:quinone reductase-like Zn-dependent oxidoreductase
MKLRYKIPLGILLTLVAAISALALVIGHTADCGPAPQLSGNGEWVKAVTYRCYGPPEVLEYVDIEKPTPAADEILVKVYAASVNPLDWHYMRGSPYLMRLIAGIGAPTSSAMGVDFAGTVEAMGDDVTNHKIGDAVFGGRNGAFGEYLTKRVSGGVTHMPDNVSFEQAAAVPIAAITALQALRDKGQLKAGQKVLINGASGGVGTYAVQIAKAWGAEVHGVCSTRNMEMVRSLGADRVFDYKIENYTESDQRYDLIIDNVSNHSHLANTRVLKPDGVLVTVGGSPGDWIGPLLTPVMGLLTQPFVSQKLEGLMAEITGEDMAILADLMRAGKLSSVIDRRYSLEEVPQAIAYSETGRAQGKIIISVRSPSQSSR